jgi:hypothetical protein
MANPRRPRDPNQRAKLIVDIATGDSDEAKAPTKRDRAKAAELARKVAAKGGRGRAAALSPERRSELGEPRTPGGHATRRWLQLVRSAR